MQKTQHLKNHIREQRVFSLRILLSGLGVLALVCLLLYRYYDLQVNHYQKYVTRSDQNRILIQTINPQRGLIYDTNGLLLADNKPSYTLSLTPERIDNFEKTLAKIRTLVAVDDKQVEDYKDQLKKHRRPYQAVPLRSRLTPEEIARIAVNEYHLSGVEVQAELIRHYPFGHLFAQSVGHVGKINEREWQNFDEEEQTRYQTMTKIGKVGLEKYYERALYGEVGFRHVETNARMRVLRTLQRESPQSGANLHLHLDYRLQETIHAIMRGKRGAVVALDVETAGVLALVSTPSYDPNLFVTGISHRDYNRLRDDLDTPLFNRAIQGLYPPASTIKPMLGLAGLVTDTITLEHQIFDPGFYRIEGDKRLYRDWKRSGHGWVNLHKSVVQSCDTFFYDMAFNMGIDNIHAFGSQFGMGKRTGIDMPNERRALWPSREWKQRVHGLPWFPGDTVNSGIGQGFSSSTPLQMAMMTNTIATRGKHLEPSLVKRMGDQPVVPNVLNYVEIDDHYWDAMFHAMRDVMHAKNGTAYNVGKESTYYIGGKTGTAQVVGIKQNEQYDSEALAERHRDHGLFVGFAPLDDPKITIAVIVENGESGSRSAAPIAKQVFDAHLLGHYQTFSSVEATSDDLKVEQ